MKRKQIIRDNFREAVYKRDGHKCKKCGKTSKAVKLDAHHITDRNDLPNGGYVASNGVTLCDTADGCHMKAEKFHTTGGKEWETGFHPDDLYKDIGSSYVKALADSKRLK